MLLRFFAILGAATLLCVLPLNEAFVSLAPLTALAKECYYPSITGSKERSSIMRGHMAAVDMNPYKFSKVQNEEYDTIVVGSGIGGLAAASMLAQNGQKVLVLEQHFVAGGACHTFSRKGYSFGTGIHYVGEAGELGPGEKFNLRTILNTLTGEGDQVQWDKMDDQAETITLGDPHNRFQIKAGSIERYKESLEDMFPEEKEAIGKFLDLCQKAQKPRVSMVILKVLPYPVTRFLVKTGLYRLIGGGYRKLTETTIADVLEELTDNEDLRAVLSGNFIDFGVEPDRAPFLLQAMIHLCYSNGSFYPRGGPSSLSRKVIKNILSHGGKVLTKASVKRILLDTDGKTVTGVEMQDGSQIHATSVVSDVGIHTTATKLLPSGLLDLDFGKSDQKNDEKLHPSSSGVNLFVGLKGSPKCLNLPNGVNFVYPSNDLSGSIERLRSMDLDQALSELKPIDIPMFISIPCTADSDWDTNYPDKSVLEIIMFAPWHWFEKYARDFEPSAKKSHGPEYTTAKTKLAKLMWGRAVEVVEYAGAKVPHDLEDTDLFEVATPLTFEHYYQADHGGWYGVESDKNRLEPSTSFLKLRPKVHGVNGLYLAGQDVLSMGIEPCALSGVMCAATVLGHKGNPFAMLMPKDDDQDHGIGKANDNDKVDWSIWAASHAL